MLKTCSYMTNIVTSRHSVKTAHHAGGGIHGFISFEAETPQIPLAAQRQATVARFLGIIDSPAYVWTLCVIWSPRPLCTWFYSFSLGILPSGWHMQVVWLLKGCAVPYGGHLGFSHFTPFSEAAFGMWFVICVNVSGFHSENGRVHVYVWQQFRAHHLQRHHSPTGCMCPALTPAPNGISFGKELSTFHCLRAWCFCELLVHSLCPFAFWDVHRFYIGVTSC